MSERIYVRLSRIEPTNPQPLTLEGYLLLPPTKGLSIWLDRRKKNGQEQNDKWRTSVVRNLVHVNASTTIVHTQNSTYNMEVLRADPDHSESE